MNIPYGYCHCGCGFKTPIAKKTYSRFGYVKGEPYKWCKGHMRHRKALSTEYDIDESSGCWNWNGDLSRSSRSKGGLITGYPRYGHAWRIRNPGRTPLAHRIYYEDFVGKIPEKYHIDHLCSNRRCVNPNHLEAVTPSENNRRARRRSELMEAFGVQVHYAVPSNKLAI